MRCGGTVVRLSTQAEDLPQDVIVILIEGGSPRLDGAVNLDVDVDASNLPTLHGYLSFKSSNFKLSLGPGDRQTVDSCRATHLPPCVARWSSGVYEGNHGTTCTGL